MYRVRVVHNNVPMTVADLMLILRDLPQDQLVFTDDDMGMSHSLRSVYIETSDVADPYSRVIISAYKKAPNNWGG